MERAIDDGFGSVMYDGSALPLEENVATTRRLVERARARDDGLAVEAELGRIGGREDTDPADAWASRTTPREAVEFVDATGIDVLAPNLGNLHRMPDDSMRLEVGQIRAIAEATGRPLALHGGSGVELEQLRAAIEAGVGKVNISSRVTRALAAGIRETWAEDPEQLDLRRYLGRGREAVQALAAAYIDRCGVAGRASAPGEPASPPAGPVWTAHDTEAE